MRHDEVSDPLRVLAFDFFFRFSRFEYALKEARFLKDKRVGANAEASWDGFIAAYRNQYVLSSSGRALVEARPQRQIVGEYELEFRDLVFNPGASDLEKVVRLTNTVRNNLFHGGKHSVAYWDDPERMQLLLATTVAALNDLAAQTGLGPDYERYY
jgi:hypothetical protein